VLNDLFVLHARIRLLTKCHYFPYDHAERPNVRLRSEYAVNDGLGRHPSNWQRLLIVRLSIVIIHVDLSGKAKVAQFNRQIVIVNFLVWICVSFCYVDKTIPSCDVSMDYLYFFQVFTPFHNVQANLDGHFVLERVGLALLSQKGQEVALVHVLEYDELRIVFGLVADSIEVNQVRVVDRVQRDRFFQEVQFC